MKSWFKHPADFSRDPRIIAAANSLDLKPFMVAGAISVLYGWAIEFAEDGDISSRTDETLATLVGCDVPLISSLHQNGLIAEGRLADWLEFCQPLIDSRRNGRERKRLWTERQKSVTEQGGNAEVTVTEHAKKKKEKENKTDIPTNVGISPAPSEKPVPQTFNTAMKEALVAASGITPASNAEWKKVQLAVNLISQAGGTAEQIPERYANLKAHWPNITIEPLTLANKWGLAEHPPVRPDPRNNGSKPRQGGRAVDSVKWKEQP